MTKENLENVGGSLAEGFEVGEDVFVGKNSTPAKIVKLLSDGYVKIEWPKSEGTEWESEYHVDKLQKLGARRRKQSALGERPDGEQQEAPTKKIKKETKQENSSIKESLLPSLSTSVNESDGTCSSSYASSAKSSVKPEPKQTKVSTVKRKTKPKPAVPDLWQVSGVDKDQGLKEIKGLLPKGLKRCAQEVVHFFLFCYERQMVWERRNLGEPEPYSESKTMQEYLFCNNYRELDRGTNYFRAQILDLWDKYSGDEPIDQLAWIELVLFASLCYRLVNRVTTFEDFGGIPELSEFPRLVKWMKKRSKMKDVVLFTDAHVTGGLGPFLKSMASIDADKIKKVSELLLECSEVDDLKGCFTTIKALDGVGPFISWQIVCDLMESQCLKPCTEEDWAQLGPGAKKGINHIFGARHRQENEYLELAETLRDIQDEVYKAVGLEFPKWNGVPLTLKNIEHPLCEFQKYLVIHGKMVRKQNIIGQRRIKTKAHLDFDKACHYVKSCGVEDDILLCDKCLIGFCNDCALEKNEDSQYWVCPRCRAFESVTFE